MLFSVLIPSYNRRSVLEQVLRAYEQQQPAHLPFEIVVVDDGSTDGTADWLAEQRPKRFHLRFQTQLNAGPAQARNRALELASGRIVMITGDDIEPTPNLVAEHWRAHQAHDDPSVAILGLTRWAPGSSVTNTMRHIDGTGAQQFSYAHMQDGAEYDFRHFYTSNVSLHRELLDRDSSYFSTDFKAAAFEDAEYAYRLSSKGLRILYHAAAVAFHHHPYGARSFFKRQIRCGAMAAILYGKHPEVRKHLDLDYLDEQRIETIGQRLNLEAWQEAEERALRFSGALDPLPFSVDEWLAPLFRYGYLRGLAKAMYTAETAERLCAWIFQDLIPEAGQALARRVRYQRLPIPSADLEALTALSRFPA